MSKLKGTEMVCFQEPANDRFHQHKRQLAAIEPGTGHKKTGGNFFPPVLNFINIQLARIKRDDGAEPTDRQEHQSPKAP